MSDYNNAYEIYDDINKRTKGEIYLGVVGPVRTGKSTFIKNFMRLAVLPNVEDEMIDEMLDELPQSANGKMIMTTEPKFIPKEAIKVPFGNTKASVRLIDCVGFMVEGATGHIEDMRERMVKTPWFEQEIPFSKAAYIGTKRVIDEHATIGIVITTDGTFGDIPGESFETPLSETINELNKTGKPYIVILNTTIPESKQAMENAEKLSKIYNVQVIPMDVNNMDNDDIDKIFETILMSFPITEISFKIPEWLMLPNCDNEYEEVLNMAKEILENVNNISDASNAYADISDCQYIDNVCFDSANSENGKLSVSMSLKKEIYYDKLSDIAGEDINNEYDLIMLLSNLSGQKEKTAGISKALENVGQTGYGYILGTRDEITLDEPVLVRDGSKFGVSIMATAPSLHVIKADIKTQISPIVGSKEEAEDLIKYIKNNGDSKEGIWKTNIFGKTIEQTVLSSINQKAGNMTNENVEKLKETMEKVINDNNGLVCLIV